MITSETSDPNSALAALRLINKARQCAKRGDVNGMRFHTYHAHVECDPAQNVPPRGVDNTVALQVTFQIKYLHIIARKGNCDTFVRHTSRLWRDVRELVEAMHEQPVQPTAATK